MKIVKFGSIYMLDDQLIIDGFCINFQGATKPLTKKGMQLAVVEAINAFMKSKADEGFQIEETCLTTPAAIAPPVAAGSVDTPEFEKLLVRWSTAGGGRFGLHEQGIPELRAKIVEHIDSWGAQQSEQGKAEQTTFLKECMDRGQAEFNRKWTEQKERAEKAEANLKQVNEWRAAALAESQALGELWAAKVEKAEARVKELETGRHALQAEGKHPAPCARHCEAQAFKIEVRRLEAVELDMHRKLAAETLRADQGWARYEAANRAKNDLEKKLADATPYALKA